VYDRKQLGRLQNLTFHFFFAKNLQTFGKKSESRKKKRKIGKKNVKLGKKMAKKTHFFLKTLSRRPVCF
jgi:hypothetical protein